MPPSRSNRSEELHDALPTKVLNSTCRVCRLNGLRIRRGVAGIIPARQAAIEALGNAALALESQTEPNAKLAGNTEIVLNVGGVVAGGIVSRVVLRCLDRRRKAHREGRPRQTNIRGLTARGIIGLLHVGIVKAEITGGIASRNRGRIPVTALVEAVFQSSGSPDGGHLRLELAGGADLGQTGIGQSAVVDGIGVDELGGQSVIPSHRILIDRKS